MGGISLRPSARKLETIQSQGDLNLALTACHASVDATSSRYTLGRSPPVLVSTPDDRYGRSYMEHVVALAQTPDDDGSIPADVRAAARLLRETPSQPPPLITIGKPDLSALEAARTIADFARARVDRQD